VPVNSGVQKPGSTLAYDLHYNNDPSGKVSANNRKQQLRATLMSDTIMNTTQEDTMKRQASLVTVLGASSALLVGLAQVGLAQSGPPPGWTPPTGAGGPPSGFQGGPPSGFQGQGGGTGEAGAISNTTTTTETTSFEGDAAFASDTGTLPNTGGAPLLMALAGGLTAAGAFCLRRKIS
jgi:hypothetical protein